MTKLQPILVGKSETPVYLYPKWPIAMVYCGSYRYWKNQKVAQSLINTLGRQVGRELIRGILGALKRK